MDLTRLLLVQALTFASIMSRIAGFTVVSPLPAGQAGPTQAVGFVCVMSWVVSLYAQPLVPLNVSGPRFFSTVALELGCGIAIGFGFRLTVAMAETVGSLYAQATGLSTPSIYNPSIESQETALARAVTLLALLLAIAAGVHRIALGYLLESFRILPVGSAISLEATAPVFVSLAGSSLAEGMRLAMPLVAISLVTQVALAIVARAAPSMQIFSVGLTVLIVTGFTTILSSVDGLGSGLNGYFGSLPARMNLVMVALSGRAP